MMLDGAGLSRSAVAAIIFPVIVLLFFVYRKRLSWNDRWRP